MGRQSLILALPLTATYCATRSRKLITTTTKRREAAYLLLSLPLPSPSRPLRSSVMSRRSSASTAAASLKQSNPNPAEMASFAPPLDEEISLGGCHDPRSSSSSTSGRCQGSSSSLAQPRSAWSPSSLAQPCVQSTDSAASVAANVVDLEVIGLGRESHDNSDNNAECAKKRRHALLEGTTTTTDVSSSASTSSCTTVTPPERSEEERIATEKRRKEDVVVGVEEKDGSKDIDDDLLVCPAAVEIDKTELVEALPQELPGNVVQLQARQELQPKNQEGFNDGVSFLWRLALGTGAVCVGLAVISFTSVPSAVVMSASAGVKPAVIASASAVKVASAGSSAFIAPASQSVAPLVTLCQSIPSSAMPSALAGMAPAVRALSQTMADNMPYDNPHGGDKSRREGKRVDGRVE